MGTITLGIKRNGVNYQEYRHGFRHSHIPVFVTQRPHRAA